MPTATANYAVLDGRPVHLKVAIGEAQAGSSAVYLDGNHIVTDTTIDMDLPPKSARARKGRRQPARRSEQANPLRGKELLISSTVIDVQQATDRVSVRVDLSGGTPPDFPIAQTTTAHGAPVNFLTLVTFV